MSQFNYYMLTFKSGLILVRKFNGPINVSEIIASWDYLINNKMITADHIGVVNDLCDAALEMNPDTFQKLITYLKTISIFMRIKLAVICDSPEKIIYPMLGEYTVKELKIKPFSTLKAAVKWILSS